MQSERASVSESKLRIYGFAGGAILICLLLGLAMIANNQLGGEAMWLYYAMVFHHGVRLYADLHLPLQPLFILENDVWMQLLGTRTIAAQIPSVFHVLLLAVACFLVANESPWTTVDKAVMTVLGFMLVVFGRSYRFDDYHVLSESMVLYALWMLLIIARTEDDRACFKRVAWLGLFTGLVFTTRNTDGAALGVSASLALLFLRPRQRVLTVALYTAVTVAVILIIVHLTGESFSIYISKTIIRASKSKGGPGSIAGAPLHMFLNAFGMFFRQMRRIFASLLLMVGSGWLIVRFLPRLRPFVVPLEMLIFFVIVRLAHVPAYLLRDGMSVTATVLALSMLLYVAAPVIVARGAYKIRRGLPWDHRQILLIIPLAEWASYSASAAGYPLLDYYAPIAEFLLLIAVLAPFRRSDAWARPSYMAWMLVLCISTLIAKAATPYSWQNYRFPPMWTDRVWYHHPVLGEMYIDRDLLTFSTRVCEDVGETKFEQGQLPTPRPEVLSLPYSFPNYFCDTLPWHNYVQTWFDISTQETIDQLIQQINTAPPQWIVYQRQLNILDGVERLYNHDRPAPHRELDHIIMSKIQSGQWKVVDTSNYLTPNMIDATHDPTGEQWFIIRTHP